VCNQTINNNQLTIWRTFRIMHTQNTTLSRYYSTNKGMSFTKQQYQQDNLNPVLLTREEPFPKLNSDHTSSKKNMKHKRLASPTSSNNLHLSFPNSNPLRLPLGFLISPSSLPCNISLPNPHLDFVGFKRKPYSIFLVFIHAFLNNIWPFLFYGSNIHNYSTVYRQ